MKSGLYRRMMLKRVDGRSKFATGDEERPIQKKDAEKS